MKTYNLIYDKSTDLEHILNQLTELEIVVNQTFSSLGMINVSSETEIFSNIEGVIGFEEDLVINTEMAIEWHQLRVGSRMLPMKTRFIPKNTGSGVSIYLVDSGINHSHPEFETANIVNLYSYNENFDDEIGHGTAIGSVIVGKTLGISTDAILKNVKIQSGQSMPLSSLLEAFNVISEDRQDDEFAVINCSWTIPKSMILDTLVADLCSQGFLVVAAAGNTISSADNLSPVGYDAVLGVGASDAFDRVISWAPGVGSNWGKEVDLFAPGIDVMVAAKNGDIIEASGTSIAAGIVSSIAAQYIVDIEARKDTNFTIDDVQQLIILKSVPDVLFRNESIYENTPNKLIMALTLDRYYTNEIDFLIKIDPETSHDLHYEIDARYVSKINIDQVVIGTKTYHHPEWVELDELTNTITITPPQESISKYYQIYVEMLDEDNNTLAVYPVVILVGQSEQTENIEHYHWVINENDDVVVRLAACSFGNPYCGPFPPYPGVAGCTALQLPKAYNATGCACVGNYCVSF